MKVGDAVKFIGFEGYRDPKIFNDLETGVGLVLRVYRMHRIESTMRVNVLWPDGKIGFGLFEETLEVINGNG